MLLCSGTISYLSFDRNIFTSDFLIGKIVAIFMIGLLIGISSYVLYKFRILIINTESVISIHPFQLKKKKIALTKIKWVKFNSFNHDEGTAYRKVSLSSSNSKITFTDREFENFETLTNLLPNSKDKRNTVDREQAEANLSNVTFYAYTILALILFLILISIWRNELPIHTIVMILGSIFFLIVTVKRVLNYREKLNK